MLLCLVAPSFPTHCNPMHYSPSGSSVHGDSQGKNTEVGCHALLQGIFPTQGSNPGLTHCRLILYRLSHQGSLLVNDKKYVMTSGGGHDMHFSSSFLKLFMLHNSCMDHLCVNSGINMRRLHMCILKTFIFFHLSQLVMVFIQLALKFTSQLVVWFSEK